MASDDYYGWEDSPAASGRQAGGRPGGTAGPGSGYQGDGGYGYGNGPWSSSGSGSSGGTGHTGRTAAIAVVATLAVVALVGGGIWWLTSSRDSGGSDGPDGAQAAAVTSTTTPAMPSSGATTVTEQPSSSAAPETTTVYAQPQDSGSDAQDGPGHTINSVQLPGGGRVTISTLPCDGRNILISTSVSDNTPDPQGQIAQALAEAPGQAQYLVPGSCPSIRGVVDGARVYPIVTDYGHDSAALCAAAATYGGNPRILGDTAEFTSPC
ncbi:hypothetical protein [Dietzia sp.]|uniref:hypothetical protein n=1 Tax=Dietzia sp. TaxID=1871616 RepID=UPI002FDA3997